jgi:hypothetical protein
MTGYRFLLPSEEEMTEASVFYEAASPNLGVDFLDGVQRGVPCATRNRSIGWEWIGADPATPISV